MKKRRSSSSTDLQIWTPEKKRESPSSSRLDLAIVPLSQDSPANFTLPGDWVVEERKRTAGMLRGNTDKYYHEPGTGRKFRSLVSVKRYLTKTGDYEITSKMAQSDVTPLSIALPGYNLKSSVAPPSSKSRSVVKTSLLKSANQIVVYWQKYIPKHLVDIDRSKPLKLPDGWYVKRITRRSGHSMGKVDKYYCERATGRVFRSGIDVQRYLADNYIDENTTLSQLFKPAGLIQMSGSEERDIDEDGDMAIVPHSGNSDSYSDIYDDVPLKDLVRKRDDVRLKDLDRDADDIPLEDLVQECDDVPVNDPVQECDDVLDKDLDQKSDDVPLKDLVRISSARPVKKLATPTELASPTKLASLTKNVFSCTMNTCPVNVSNPPMKIKWVLTGPGGDEWSPLAGDTMVPESLKQEWAQLFLDIVSKQHSDASHSDALD
uniref:MBD domain-containing protein n=1 Tax=Kalanchoe fedtschenkoi TaxID=63787 RepID=A0A7N0TD00_KALFE